MMLNVEKVIAIQNYGASGTTLLHSLLDNHPKIMSMPYLHALPLYQLWDVHLSKIENVTFNNIKNIVEYHLPIFFDIEYSDEKSLKQMGENKNQRLEVNKKDFFINLKSYFNDIKRINRKDFIISIFVSWNLCYKRNFDEDSYICYPIHSQPKKYAEQISQDFKEVKFLHMVREPVQNIGSLIKHINANQMKNSLFKGKLTCAISQILCEEQKHWEGNYSTKVYGKRPYLIDNNNIQSRYIKLEDLHNNSKLVINKLVKWMNISFDKCLLESSFQGLLWHNRLESQRVSGFSKRIISQKHNTYLNRFDRYRLKLLSKDEQIYFKYCHYYNMDKSLFLILPLLFIFPFKCEFNILRLHYRLKAMLLYYSKQACFSINKWIIVHDTQHTVSGAICIDLESDRVFILKRIVSLILSFPSFIYRIFANFFHLRFLIMFIWLKRLFSNDTKSYIKPL